VARFGNPPAHARLSRYGLAGLQLRLGSIDAQEEHHRRLTFQEEYRNLLRKYHLEFDERYVWD
jgi:hypothetical protein